VKLRWYQEEAVDAVFDYFNDPLRAHTLQQSNPLVAMPTGTGKSLVIAELFRRAMTAYPGTRAFMGTHVKELIEQNAKKLLEIWPLAPLGIYSAGLKSRDHMQPLIYGGIQSVYNKAELFGKRDLMGIDEAHLLSPTADTRYLAFIKAMMAANPYFRVIGFTATPYRMGLGLMTNGPLFTDIVYDLCTMEGYSRLIAEGYLCRLIAKPMKTTLDVSGVGVSGGEFVQSELQDAVDKETITYAALCETVEAGYDRASWLLFASGTRHADHIGEMLNNHFGIPTVVIHSKKSDTENTEALHKWKTGQVRCAVNMNSLTTGVDHPACDLIGIMRPTNSTGLWVQMLGRGTRPFNWYDLSEADKLLLWYFTGYVKQNCLILDFARNTQRLGPINDPIIPKLKGQGPPGDAPVKICQTCGSYCHTSARVCDVCGAEFTFQENITRASAGLDVMRSDLPQFEHFNVDRVVMVPHTSKAGNDSIKVAYFCGLRTFYEYKSVESPVNFMKHKSRDWFRQRYHYADQRYTWEDDVPATNAEVLALAHELRWPKQIQVWVNKQNPEIVGYEF
jgi:DNA repair protein RadD